MGSGIRVKRKLRPTEEQIVRNVYHNIRLGVEQVWFYQLQETQIALCCGGPSLAGEIENIRRLQLEERAEVVALGNAAATLTSHGIKPNGHILMDGSARNRSFVVPVKDTRYLVASQCDPGVFNALRDHAHVYIWHTGALSEEREVLDKWYGVGGWFACNGGSYITLRAISVLRVLGFRWIHLFGFDSCLQEGEHHAYSQPNADNQQAERVKMGDREFLCNYWMLDQVDQFLECLKLGLYAGINLNVHGDGLISHMIETRSRPTWQLR